MGTAFFAVRKRKNRKAAGEEGEKVHTDRILP